MATKKPNSKQKVENLAIRPHQGVVNGEIIATWDWSFKSTTSGFSYTWEYTNGDSWISASSGTTDVNHRNALYSPPTGAKRVRFSVLPISTTVEKNGAETNVWIITSPTKIIYDIGKQPEKLSTPSTPSLSINLYKALLSVNYTDLGATGINFYLISDTSKTVSGPYYAALFYGKASIEVSISPNQTYRAYCKAINATPYTSSNTTNPKIYYDSDLSEYSSEVDSPPEGVTITKIESTSETSVKIIFNRTTNGDKYDVEYTEEIDNFDKSDSVNSKSIDVIKRSTTYILLSGLETGKEWFFRVRVSNDAGTTEWSNIYAIVLGMKPNPPTIWSSTYSGIIDEDVVLYWTHNTLDGSKEIDALLTFEIFIRSASTFEISSDIKTVVVPNTKTDDEITTSSYTFKPNLFKFIDGVVTKINWYAQTKGVLDEYSEKSVINTINFYIKPEINVQFGKKNKWYWDLLDLKEGNIYTTPGEITEFYEEEPFTLISFPLYVEAQVTPLFDNHPLECYISIFAEDTYQSLNHMGEVVWVTKGTEVYSKTLNKYVGEHKYSIVLTPGDVVLENYQRYRFFIRAVMDNGLIAEYETYFDVDFEDVPFSINAEISYNEEDVSTYIQPYCVDDNGDPIPLTYLSVYRKNFDGEFVEIASGINNESNTTVIDPHPTLKNVQYRISVFSVFHGTINFTDLAGYPIPETAIVIQWDEAWSSFESDEGEPFTEPVQTSSMLKLPFNVDTSESNTIDATLVEYIGRKHPVGYYGTQVGQKMSLSCDVPYYDKETISMLRRLSVWMGDVYVREPSGIGYWAQVSVGFSQNHLELAVPVSIEVTRVEGGV